MRAFATGNSIQALVSQYLPEGKSIDAELRELAEKWNPLLATEQKKDLVEDVNSLVRDFLRPIRRSFVTRRPTKKGFIHPPSSFP